MGIEDAERNLKIIRHAIGLSSSYTNITAAGYFFTGVVALIGFWRTYTILGKEKITDLSLIATEDLRLLMTTWFLVFFSAIVIVMFFSWRKAAKNQISAWNSLAARMLFSQIPLISVAGIFTIAMASKGFISVIPGLWLGIYGVVLYSFSYFTGKGHKIEGLFFIGLGSIALFVPDRISFLCLGAGFCGIHMVSGLVRLLPTGKGLHESESTQ